MSRPTTASIDAGVESIPRVIAAVAKRYGIRTSTMLGPGKSKRLSEARAVAMYLVCRRYAPQVSYPEAGRYFARHHTTLIQQCRNVDRRLKSSDAMRALIAELERELDPQLLPRRDVPYCDACGQPMPERTP